MSESPKIFGVDLYKFARYSHDVTAAIWMFNSLLLFSIGSIPLATMGIIVSSLNITSASLYEKVGRTYVSEPVKEQKMSRLALTKDFISKLIRPPILQTA